MPKNQIFAAFSPCYPFAIRVHFRAKKHCFFARPGIEAPAGRPKVPETSEIHGPRPWLQDACRDVAKIPKFRKLRASRGGGWGAKRGENRRETGGIPIRPLRVPRAHRGAPTRRGNIPNANPTAQRIHKASKQGFADSCRISGPLFGPPVHFSVGWYLDFPPQASLRTPPPPGIIFQIQIRPRRASRMLWET